MYRHTLTIVVAAAALCLAAQGCKPGARQVEATPHPAAIQQQDTLIAIELCDMQRDRVPIYSIIAHNQLTVIDFWASWCGPCRQEAPLMVSLYHDFQAKGLGFVGISLDEDYSRWQEGVSQLALPWPQYSELRGWDETMARQYGVTSIPYTLVVDNHGKILARGLRGDGLRRFISGRL